MTAVLHLQLSLQYEESAIRYPIQATGYLPAAVPVTPFSSAGSVEMGIDTVNHIGDSLAVILAHHGVMTIGKDIKQALYAAVYLEECAKGYLAARAVGPTRSLTPEQIQQSIDVFKFYGQDTAPIPKDLTKRL